MPETSPDHRDEIGPPSRRAAKAWFALSGLTWSVFCLWLARDGHAPSVALLPIAKADYYRFQAGFVVPVLLVLLWVHGRSALLFSGQKYLVRQDRDRADRVVRALHISVSAPLLLLWLLPEMVVYGTLGFEALGATVRVAAPLTFVVALALGARALQKHTGTAGARAHLAACMALLLIGLLAGPVLR